MTITVTQMRSNKLVNMDIEQLRWWATFMDRAMVVSLVVTGIAVAALGISTWLSFRFSGAVRAHEYVAFHRYKVETDRHVSELQQDVAAARERTRELDQALTAADQRAAQAARDSANANEKARTASENARTANEKARSAEIDAEEVRKRVAELGKAVREATARPPDPAPAPGPAPAPVPVPGPVPAPPPAVAAETPSAVQEASPAKEAAPARETNPSSEAGPAKEASPVKEASPPPTSTATREEPPSPIVAALRKYAGTKAAVYVLDEAPDAPAQGAMISGYLNEAGWAPLTWTWTGVGGIVGVVVLIKDGSDQPTDAAASAVMDALRSAGFNVAKGNWPADWRRFRGTLNGPQTPAPTDAPIRIVIGSKAR
jgi:outer membrane biosynthesis protein TonB